MAQEKNRRWLSLGLFVLLLVAILGQQTHVFAANATQQLTDGKYTIKITTEGLSQGDLGETAELTVSEGKIKATLKSAISSGELTFTNAAGEVFSADSIPLESDQTVLIGKMQQNDWSQAVVIRLDWQSLTTIGNDSLANDLDEAMPSPASLAEGTYQIQLAVVQGERATHFEKDNLLQTATLEKTATELSLYLTSRGTHYIFPNNAASVYQTDQLNGLFYQTYKVSLETLDEPLTLQYWDNYTVNLTFDQKTLQPMPTGELVLVANPEKPENPDETKDVFQLDGAEMMIPADGEYTIQLTALDALTGTVHEQDQNLLKPANVSVKNGVITVTFSSYQDLLFANLLSDTLVSRQLGAESNGNVKKYQFTLAGINQLMEVWYPADIEHPAGSRLMYHLSFDAQSLSKINPLTISQNPAAIPAVSSQEVVVPEILGATKAPILKKTSIPTAVTKEDTKATNKIVKAEKPSYLLVLTGLGSALLSSVVVVKKVFLASSPRL